MITTTQITEEQWLEQFKPTINELDPNAGWNQTMFETYGVEADRVNQTDEAFIWTWLEAEGGTYLVNGYHYVNRLGYFICQTPVPEGQHFEVVIDEPEEYCEECCNRLEDCECEKEVSA